MKKLSCIFIDFDDTLVKTQYRYDRAYKQALRIAAERIGTVVEHDKKMENLFKDTFDSVERSLYEEGYNVFLPSYEYALCETYRLICSFYGRTPSRDDMIRIMGECADVWVPPFEAADGAKEAMKKLRMQNPYASISVLTLGYGRIQKAKFESVKHEFDGVFDSIVCVDSKDELTYLSIIEERGVEPSSCVMIGNSAYLDVMPPLKVGMNAVHLDNNTCHHGNVIYWDDKHRERLRIVKSIVEVPDAVEDIKSS